MTQVFAYRWLHIPTGATGKNDTCYWSSRRAFLRSLQEWNRADNEWWYWEA